MTARDMNKEELGKRATLVLRAFDAEGIGLVNALEILASALAHVAVHHGVGKEEVLENLGHAYDIQKNQSRRDVQ
jgi:hypothetical protein